MESRRKFIVIGCGSGGFSAHVQRMGGISFGKSLATQIWLNEARSIEKEIEKGLSSLNKSYNCDFTRDVIAKYAVAFHRSELAMIELIRSIVSISQSLGADSLMQSAAEQLKHLGNRGNYASDELKKMVASIQFDKAKQPNKGMSKKGGRKQKNRYPSHYR
ncbi:hypothetical protein G7074_18125 [Pedobacter sp. HDW13]|uniref:hypothetical protein n=1 Tax=Pedobacter sp. HDW13 TaxID=2714940 RepID=UPI00140D8588|nr:hypothetical protein [Pedobacter sp. HDW13]QIL41013.1 hypothetical protein G7074_18125 [Pedobacter sp. HDW13]